MDYDFFLVYIIVLYKIILVHFGIQDQIRQASAFVPLPVLKTFILVRSNKVKLVKEILWTESPRSCPQQAEEC